MIAVDAQPIDKIFTGNMGIKTAYVGDTQVYFRSGGYVYIMLNTSGTEK